MLKRMKPRLPVDCSGEGPRGGFDGNLSATQRFVTDGIVCLLRSAILDGTEITENEKDELVPETRIVSSWEKWTRSPSRQAFFVGCCMSKMDTPIALVSDGKEFVFLNPWKLSWAIQAVAADSLETPKHDPRHNPVILMREKNPVGVVMPMRGEMASVDRYDISHEPVPIMAALRGLVKA